MRIIVLGGDGFCGWPTACYLSSRGHQVLIVDNMKRRNIDTELGTDPLLPISSIQDRIRIWNEGKFGGPITFRMMNVVENPNELTSLMLAVLPHAVVHFAELRAAPYSMIDLEHRRVTVRSNMGAAVNLLNAIVACGRNAPHLVHLGTMGVYGYGAVKGAVLPEGYLKVRVPTPFGEQLESEAEILHPMSPGSVYHTTKAMEQIMFAFYAKNDGVRITDLHQGIVWGTEIEETLFHPMLNNRFDYDGVYGTVLNRFLVQAANDIPLTIHGVGGQTRAFINIEDTVRCVEMAIENPPESGDRVCIRNQAAEAMNLNDLALLVKKEIPTAKISYVDNPRKELAENDLRFSNQSFVDLGWKPKLIKEWLQSEAHMVRSASQRRAIPLRTETVLAKVKW